jgi:protein-S-isoprenylcysteine O-methyltransferase Ste14
VSATKPPAQRRAPARVVVALALLIAFSFVGGFGVTLNETRAILVGWLGFAVVLLVAYLMLPARRRSGQPGSTDGA